MSNLKFDNLHCRTKSGKVSWTKFTSSESGVCVCVCVEQSKPHLPHLMQNFFHRNILKWGFCVSFWYGKAYLVRGAFAKLTGLSCSENAGEDPFRSNLANKIAVY